MPWTARSFICMPRTSLYLYAYALPWTARSLINCMPITCTLICPKVALPLSWIAQSLLVCQGRPTTALNRRVFIIVCHGRNSYCWNVIKGSLAHYLYGHAGLWPVSRIISGCPLLVRARWIAICKACWPPISKDTLAHHFQGRKGSLARHV